MRKLQLFLLLSVAACYYLGGLAGILWAVFMHK